MTIIPPILLTGEWQVHPVDLDSTDLSPAANNITVPDSAHLQTVLYPDRPYWGEHLRAINQTAWLYQRTITLPETNYRRARLRFEGVDYFAAVWLNGQPIGEHEGHFAPFTFDITSALRPDAPNTLSVRVSSPWDAPNPGGSYPVNHVIRGLVKGHYEHGEGVIPPAVNPLGIWRPVHLLLDDGLSIDHVRVRTALDGQVELRLTLTNAAESPTETHLHLNVSPENHDGAGCRDTCPIVLPPGTHHIDHTLHVPDPHLWWPWDHGQPNLYRLDLTLNDSAGESTAQHTQTFGIRTVRLERTPQKFTYFINERPVFLRGSSYIPALYLAQVTTDLLQKDLEQVRAANLNLLRLHIHVSPPELYDLCDRAGILLWQDFELNWVQEHTPAFEARALRIQRDMIDLLGSHPSVITWACHNEPTMIYTYRHNLEQHPDPALYADALRADPTRPVFICSGQMEEDWQRAGDIHSYYGSIWTKRYTDMYSHRFRLNTEFGFEAPAALSTLRQYPDVWERLQHLEPFIEELWSYQAELIQFQVEHLRRQRSLCSAGYVHFWFVDLVPQVGLGVLDSNRVPKQGFEALRRASQPLHVALQHDGRKPYALWIFNDLMQPHPNARLRWEVRASDDQLILDGEQAVDVPANSAHKVVDTRWSFPSHQAARVEVSLISHDGHLLTRNTYQHPFRPTPRPRGYPWKFDPYLGIKVFNRPDAPSLADHNVHSLLRLIPLTWREALAEFGMRQQLPLWLVTRLARVGDWLLS